VSEYNLNFSRQLEKLCLEAGLDFHRYLMCPGKRCGRITSLKDCNLTPKTTCTRKVLTEITEWPLSAKRPEWHRDSEEPTCGAAYVIRRALVQWPNSSTPTAP
jgi:hypothetical protein